MKKILALGGSNSKTSINKKFATYVANQLENVEVIVTDLNDLDLPLYSPDLEAEKGCPDSLVQFYELIKSMDGIVLSLAEYNGNQTAAFKNLWDWLSRVDEMKFWREKPMLLMAASPGGRGGASVLKITSELLPFFGGNMIASFSLPLFHSNFSEDGIKDEALNNDLKTKITLLQNAITK
ncbi:MAG: NAD(P)H-dependent FMN reductase [Halioglobus sp.]|jgi:chromate reductase